jgi:predicted MFS family arabinose efflux permease
VLYSVKNLVLTFVLVAIGIAVAAGAIYVGDTDDAPGASLVGIVLMIGAVVLAVRIARRKA